MDLAILQHYWWIIISILAGALVFLLFVQGGQSLLYSLGKTQEEKGLIVNSLGRKWEFTFTTLVVFGGAFFAAFPLFYSTSFGGAYLVWMLLLFTFVIQAVSYEYRMKPNNFLGQRTYEAFLRINGYLAPLIIGTVTATLFTGAPFVLNDMMQVSWATSLRGLDALLVAGNYTLALAVFFLSRTLACLFLLNTVDNQEIYTRARKYLLYNSIPFVVTFLLFLVYILLGKGYDVQPDGEVVLQPYKYFYNLLEIPVNTVIFLIGVVAVLFGIIRTLLSRSWTKGIWYAGAGTILTVFGLFILAGFNHTAFYPSTADINSSLTIQKASSSKYTLETMSYVSIIIPFVIAYIWYAWRALTRKSINADELKGEDHSY